jgi:hypothetical protein
LEISRIIFAWSRLEIAAFFSVLKLRAPEAIFSAPSTLASSSFPCAIEVSRDVVAVLGATGEEDLVPPLLNRGAIGAQLLTTTSISIMNCEMGRGLQIPLTL